MKEKFIESLKRLKSDHQFSDQETVDYTTRVSGTRVKSYSEKLVKRYGLPLIKKAMAFAEKLPKSDRQGLSAEEMIFKYAETHPKNLTAQEIKLFFNKDGTPKNLIKSDLLDELPSPEWNEQEGGFVPKAKIKIKPKEPQEPSLKDFEKLDPKEQRQVLVSLGALREE